ncbi:endospore germination permease [Alicyclobacillus cycloheptanicus]|uniref:Spore germination protein (Amino acid permease) n=1 Tax=Alicyclobacillus cycloheptanicus TaxID=1457 RepID=A0ABT9XDN4_9BACL|nr:endospore germination permease [Alicyclobacillus cycloheptanicus]MDQ0188385.1 spore germination protein (amino acid permease) [Alicyclobacillus cycloheptanicus]WDM01091.1 endospore germination permease [Alicyclobacillus cycloheptanicus]
MTNESFSKPLSVLQLSMLVFTTVGVMDHVIIIPLLLQAAKRDAWISVLSSGALLMVGTLCIYLISHNTAQTHIKDWLQKPMHGRLWYPISLLIVAQLFLMAVITLRDTCTWAKTMYLQETPIFWIVLVLIAGCFFAARSGITTIAISNGILLPMIVLLGIFVSLGNMPHKNYMYLRPILENGYAPVIHGMVFASSAFSEIIIVLFLQPLIKTKIRWYVFPLIGLGLIGLTIGPLMGAISEFGPFEASRLRYPPYEEWRLLTFRHFIEHVDFLSIYQWLAGAYIRISLAISLIPEVMRTSANRRSVVLFAASVTAGALAIYPISDETFIHFVSDLYLPAFFALTVFTVATLFVLSWRWKAEAAQ